MMKLKLRHALAVWIIGGLGFLLPILQHVSDPDTWWHLKTGQLIWTSRSVPTTDPFSFTTIGERWINHEWLSQVFFYQVFAHFGFIGLIVMKAVLVTTLMCGIYILVRRYTKHEFAAIGIMTLCALAGARFWNPRPQLFSYLFVIGLLILLGKSIRSKALWLAVPMFWLWSNLHGGWAFGFLVMGMVLLESAVVAIREGKRSDALRMAGVLVCSLLAVLAGPSPIGRLLYPIGYFSGRIPTGLVLEFRSPNFLRPGMWPYDLLVLVLLTAMILGRKRMPISQWAILLLTLFLSVRSIRHVPLFGIVAAPVLAMQINAVLEHYAERGRSFRELQGWWPVNLLLLLVIPALIVLKMPRVNTEEYCVRYGMYPAAACQFLLDEPIRGEGRLLNDYGWGGFLIYKLYPKYKVSIDGRADLHYGHMTAAIRDFEAMSPEWEAFVDSVNPDVILLPINKPVVNALREDPDWLLVYEDDVAVVFARSE
ncbi:MAG TPA: hypothetical protein VFI02_10890 [Armatimonadota bacterium]|nr:hypothetical protein [Armatimonadota bacterium]